MSYFHENGLFYELNNDNYTSIIKTCNQNIQTITIPQSIYYQSHNYIIIAIGPFSFAYHENIQNVEFACDSKIEIIDKEALFQSYSKINYCNRIQKHMI